MANILKFDIDKSSNLVKLHTCRNLVNRSRNIKIVVEDSCDVIFVKNGQVADNINETTTHKRIKSDEHKYYFVNKQLVVQEDFITKDFLEYRDHDTNDIVLLGARCVVDISVSDSKLFVQKLIDFKLEYTKQDLLNDIMPRILEHFGGCLLQIINTQKIEYSQLDAHKTKIDALLLTKIQPIVAEYGVKIAKFGILQFISPLKTTLLLASGNTVASNNLPQVSSVPGNTSVKPDMRDISKELIALIEDQMSILVDKSLDKIQIFVDQTIQSITTQVQQQLSDPITSQDKQD